jgi:hypothetical protein
MAVYSLHRGARGSARKEGQAQVEQSKAQYEDHRTARPAAVNRGPDPRLVVLAVVAALVAGAAILQGGLLILHPVAAGSRLSVIGTTRDCQERMSEPPSTAACLEINYAPGADVGIVFHVRNNGLLPMTLTSFNPLGVPVEGLYELQPATPGAGSDLGPSGYSAFKRVSVPAGGEVPVALIGSFGSCEAVRNAWTPGSYGGISTVAVNVEWGVMGIDHYVELPVEIHLRAPDRGQCP